MQSISAIESKYEAESIPCTCKVSEIIPMNSNLYDRSTENGTAEKVSGTRVSGYIEETEDVPCMKVNIRNGNVCNVGTAAQQPVLLQSPLLVQAKPKKSIFDFDFDEDDDPLYSLKAEATIAANLKKESTQTSNKAVYQLDLDTNDLSFSPIERTELTDKKMAEETLNKPLIQEVCPIYKIEEDPFCIAKQHFDQQTQRITKLHLDALHNFLIPNVNGNWDVRSQDEIKSKKYIDINYEITDNIVPKYNFLTVESMQDNLTKISHFKSSMPKNVQTSTDQLCAIPFLGVTHTPPINSLGKIITNHKTCHREKSAILGSSSVNTVYRVLPDLMNCSSDNSSVPSSITEITSKECTNRTNILVKSPDVACNLVVKNKFNKDFDDNAVNIAGKGKDFLQLSAQNIQHFLKPVERMDNISASFTNTPVSLTNLPRLLKKKYDTDIKPQHRFLGQSQPSMESLFGSEINNDISHKPLKNLLATDLSADAINMWNVNKMSLSTNIDKYMCITSTLNQMQTPLNLKRKFQGSSGDIRAEKIHRHKGCSRRRFYNDTTESNAKRNKIAINGSSQISNEDIRKQLTDGFVDSNVDVHDKVVVKKVDYESESTKSADISAFQREQSNLACTVEELADMSEKNVFHEIRRSFNLNEYENDEYNCGDCRDDIAVHSTDRKHIVLTIKKSPNQSDSPSKTHYVTPPVIISNNMEGCQSGINKSTTGFTIQNSNIPSYTYKKQIDLNSCIMRSKMGEVVEGKIVLAKNSINIENTATNDFVAGRAKSIYEDNAMCNSISESKRHHTVAKCLRNIKPHRKLFFPREIFFKDYDGTKRSILNISSCSSSCTELSEHDDSNDSFTAASSCEPKINTQASFEGRSELSKGMNETCGNNSSAVQLWKRLSSSCTYSNNNKLSTIAVDNNEDSDVVISECVEKQFIKNLKYPIPNNDSKIKDGHMLDGTIDINMNCNPKGANNSLLETTNDIYFTAGKVEASTIFISQHNDIISENVWADNTVACPSSVDDNLQKQNFSNKSCDGYNVFYDKTRITNLISSYTNEPSLFKTFIWNKQNCMNSGIQLQDDSVLNLSADDKSSHNVCREQIKHKTYKRSGHNGNFYNKKTSTESKDCASHEGQVTYSCQENNGNYARLQLFREWHQVLQLRSYNDELITVLPYVVFD